MSDLLPRVAAGDTAAVQQCLERYGPLVWSMVRRSLREDSLAEDAVQEIFIQVWKSANRFDVSKGSERTWITTLTRRRLIDLRRKQAVRGAVENLPDDVSGLPEDGLQRALLDEEAEEARLAMSQLKPEQQRLLSLSFLDGLSHAEISSQTGIPLGTVKTHLRTGLERLRVLLQSSGGRTEGEVAK